MPTTIATPTTPFADVLADLPIQFLEASTRAIGASTELYAELLTSQADATRELVEAYVAVGRQAPSSVPQTAQSAETAQSTERAATRTARSSARAGREATRRTAPAVRKATRRATPPAPVAVEAPIAGYDALSAEELIAKLADLPQATLAQVAAYERAHEARPAVLERVAALTGPESDG